MVMPNVGFNHTAENLARNPLGIIALFIVLVYGIAALVLGISSSELDPTDRKLLVWFLVLFPLVVLLIFYRLVTAHHTKLYAPRDFHDREGFFRALTPSERKERLEREIREFESPVTGLEKQRSSGLELEVTERLGLPIRQAWMLAEELAFRELENEFGVPVNRQVAVVGPDTGVDGALVHNGKVIIIEVKLTGPERLLAAVRRAANHLVKLSRDTCASSFIAAVVVDGMQSLREADVAKAKEVVNASNAPIQLRLYDFNELKRKHGIDASEN